MTKVKLPSHLFSVQHLLARFYKIFILIYFTNCLLLLIIGLPYCSPVSSTLFQIGWSPYCRCCPSWQSTYSGVVLAQEVQTRQRQPLSILEYESDQIHRTERRINREEKMKWNHQFMTKHLPWLGYLFLQARSGLTDVQLCSDKS